jgi:LacI family transcriptional regulator
VDRFIRRATELTGKAPVEIVANKLSEMSGYEAMKGHLRRRAAVDGLYTVSDALALGAYRAVKEGGLSIPGDVAVVGIGDYEIAPFFDPPLSSVGVSHQELASHASNLLLRQLGRGAKAGETVVVPAVNVIRASSGS